MTYSIVARDPVTGELGVAVQSHYFGVGQVVPWAETGVGAIATQAFAEISYGPNGLARMRESGGAAEALTALVAADDDAPRRQVAMVDASGGVLTHTGEQCIPYAGHRLGDGWSVQANMMTNDTVPDAMAAAYEACAGDLLEHLLVALEAAEGEGGDIRGKQSAAVLIAGERSLRLHVDDHPEPLVELRRLVTLHRAYTAAGRGNADEALALAPDNPEIRFWIGLGLVSEGDERGRDLLDAVYAEHDGWPELVRRLPAAGVIPDDPDLLHRLLGDRSG